MHDHFLLGLYAVEQPRRSRIVYCVLKNEMTVSTEYWALRYDILPYTRVLPDLLRTQFEAQMTRLVQSGALLETEKGVYVRTSVGDDLWQQYQVDHYQLQHPEIFVRYKVTAFNQTMLLAQQIMSEWSYGNKTYYPMQIEQQQMAFVKRWFQQQDKDTLLDQWLTATTAFLSTLEQAEANRFVATWSGHEVIGLTNQQLDLPDTWDDWDATMWQRDMFATWLAYLEKTDVNPIHELVSLVAQLSGPLTKVQKSLAGLQAGLNEEMIAQQQHLKVGTVREHLLTAAIWLPLADFPYERFITPQVKAYFEEKLTGPIDCWRFTTIRLTDDPYEFLVFRLYQIWLTKQEVTV